MPPFGPPHTNTPWNTMRLFSFLFTLYGASHLYIYWCLLRMGLPRRWRIPAALLLLIFAGAWFYRLGRTTAFLPMIMQDISFIWMGFAIIATACFLAADAGGLIIRTVLRAIRPAWAQNPWLKPRRCLLLALFGSLLGFSYAKNEAQTPQVVTLEIRSPKIPSGTEPLRLVHVTDTHTSNLIRAGTQRRMAAIITGLRPDLLLATGDIVDTDMTERMAEARIWEGIPTPLGKFFVTGNHEFYRGVEQSLAFITRAGFIPLRGAEALVGPLRLVGVDDDRFLGSSTGPETTSAAPLLANDTPERYVVLLKHKPYVDKALIGKFDLQLSGHTHGGQIWPGKYITQAIYGVEQGLTTHTGNEGQQSLLYTSNGLGFWGPPVRLFTPPEITLIILSPEDSPESAQPYVDSTTGILNREAP